MGCFSIGIVGKAVLVNFGALRIVRVQAYGLTSLPRALVAPSGEAVVALAGVVATLVQHHSLLPNWRAQLNDSLERRCTISSGLNR
jgi:hypothetical protein